MKKRTRIITLILSITMLFSAFTTQIFADTNSSTKGFDGKIHYHNSKFKNYNVMHGVDLSEWQDTITPGQFQLMKEGGVDFVILRCGCTFTESLSHHEDPQFDNNYAGAKKAGLKIGAYYYSAAVSKSEAKSEANFVKKVIKNKHFDMPIYIDVEDNDRQAEQSKKTLANVINTFCSTMESSGYESGVYASLYWLENKIGTISSAYDVWCAQYYSSCQYSGDYNLWQYASNGKVPGLGNKYIDSNFYYTKSVPDIENFHSNPYGYDSNYITWDTSSSSKAKYELYRKQTNDVNWEKIGTFANKTNSYIDRGLSYGNKYYYKMRAKITTSGKTRYSSFTNIDYAVPRTVEIKNFHSHGYNSKTCKLTWDKVLNPAIQYWIYRSNDGVNWGEPVKILNNDTTSYLDSNLKTDSKYYYKMCANQRVKDKNITGECTNIDYAIIRDSTPGKLSAKATDLTSCSISWSKCADKSEYQIYRSTDNENWTHYKTFSHDTTSFTDTNVTTGNKYYYKMRLMCEIDGEKYYSTFTNVDYAYPRLAPVQGFSTRAKDCRTVTVTWEKAAKYDVKYQLYRKKSGSSSWSKIGTFSKNTTQYYDKKLTPNTRYYYKMRAIYNDGTKTYKSDMTETDYGTPSIPEIENFAAKALNKKTALLTWNKSSDSNVKYAIYRGYKDHGDWGNAKARLSNSHSSYKDSKVKTGIKNYYMMRAYCIVDGKTYYGPYTKMDYAYPR